jgi:hypothetical protein
VGGRPRHGEGLRCVHHGRVSRRSMSLQQRACSHERPPMCIA